MMEVGSRSSDSICQQLSIIEDVYTKITPEREHAIQRLVGIKEDNLLSSKAQQYRRLLKSQQNLRDDITILRGRASLLRNMINVIPT